MALSESEANEPFDWLLCGVNRQSCTMRKKAPRRTISVFELPDICRTGDILLFSTVDTGAKLIQRITRSKWNHVAMVVRPAPTQTYLIEWGGGLIVQPIVERLHDYHLTGARRIALRQLSLPHMDRMFVEAKLEMLAFRLLTDPTRIDNDIFPLSSAAPHALFRSMWSEHDIVDDLSSLFCSKTVAILYKHVGLLSPRINANGVFPKHFSHHKDYRMAYINCKLSRELDLSFAPKLLYDISFKLLHQPLSHIKRLVSKEERATIIVQRCARRWLALQALKRAKDSWAHKRRHSFAEYDKSFSAKEMRMRFNDASKQPAELVQPVVDESEAHPDDIEDEDAVSNEHHPFYGI
ncbi:hypothetical protein AB1Y20_000469 [Prymnesium parvum]|uniref:Uncharacterized protein n=1 Tax=Prymnesium parvum TaxID=97485 RepID=A0AB34KAI1_PRYPA